MGKRTEQWQRQAFDVRHLRGESYAQISTQMKVSKNVFATGVDVNEMVEIARATTTEQELDYWVDFRQKYGMSSCG